MSDEAYNAILIFLTGIVAGVMIASGALLDWRLGAGYSGEVVMSYADLAAIMLAAVAVIVTVLGIFIAILAVMGYAGFQSMSKRATTDHVGKSLKQGEFRERLEKIVTAHVTNELSVGSLRKMVEERVDAVIYSNAASRAEQNDEAESGDV